MAANQYPNILSGQDLTADILNAGLPYTVWKTGNTTRTSNTTLADDPDLILALVANASYSFDMFLPVTGAAIGTGDIKVAVNYSGTSGGGTWEGFGMATTAVTSYHSAGQSLGVNAQAYGINGLSFGALRISGMIFTTTSGNLSLQWAQQTSNATGTNLRVGSYLRVFRVA